MNWELYQESKYLRTDTLTARIVRGSIVLNKAARKVIGGAEPSITVELLYAKDERAIGVRPSAPTLHAHRLNDVVIRAAPFLDHYDIPRNNGATRYTVEHVDDMLVIHLSKPVG